MKRLVLIVALLATASVLAGCGSSDKVLSTAEHLSCDGLTCTITTTGETLSFDCSNAYYLESVGEYDCDSDEASTPGYQP